MQEYFLDVVKNHYFDFEGRARRKQYWMYVLWYIVFQLIVGLVIGLLGGILGLSENSIRILSCLISLALLLPSLGIAVRRLHDIGKSGWYYFIAFIPIIGGIILLVFFCTPGETGDNQYGPDPKANIL